MGVSGIGFDNLRNVNCRTWATTNEKDRRRYPLQRNLIEYMLVEKENRPEFFFICFRIFDVFNR